MSHADLRSLRLLAILILVTSLLSSAADVQSEASRNVHWELKRVARAYNIFVFTATPYFPDRATHGRVVGKVDGKKASRKTLESYAGVFAREFSLYPGVLVVRMGLKGVVLCEELTVDGHSVGGFADFDRNTVYLNIGRITMHAEALLRGRSYLARAIHHEFFHFIDYRDNGTVRDKSWEIINPRNFRYSSVGVAEKLSHSVTLTDQHPGFLTDYSRSGVEEDKAEVFSNLIVHPAYVEHRAKRDRVLKAKVRRMKYMLARFSPSMNKAFWAKVSKIKR